MSISKSLLKICIIQMPRKLKLKIAQVLYVSKSTEEEVIFLPAREYFTFVARSNPHLNFA